MKQIIGFIKIVCCVFILAALITSCQKMNRPALGDFPKDANAPGGPLKFFAAFDGTTADPLMNAVDSIRANFAAENTFSATNGISGKAVKGGSKKVIKYNSFNDWINSKSFTTAVWFKKDGQTLNNIGGNGPEHIFSLRGNDNDYHWSNAVMFLFLEGNNASCAVKSMCVSPSNPNNPSSSATDRWFEWAGSEAITGILDNKWHHLALTYNETTSNATLYIDGVANANVKSWAGHGAIRLATSKVGEYRVGRGPRNDDQGDGDGGWLQSSFKGDIDQLRLYSTALTTAQIQALFNGKQ